jgi:agmatinase
MDEIKYENTETALYNSGGWWSPNDLKSRFMAATMDYDAARLVMLGVPMDFTVSFRPGSRFGPKAVREISEALEEYSFYQAKDLRDYPFFDAGDLYLPFGNVGKSLEMIGNAVTKIYGDGKLPFLIGGEHLISWPVIDCLANRYPDLRVLHLDAHTDLRAAYLGEALSHTAVMRLVAQKLGAKRVYQFGIRSGDRADFEYAKANTSLFPEELLAPFASCAKELSSYPLYVTIDIDVLDPAYAPGTGTPESGGIRPRELFDFIRQLAGFNVVGIDLVEIAPAYDPSGATSLLGAKLIREIILSLMK